jgi:NADP-dependent 3-hydroxy acid dehydrogenase YdfG
MERNSKELIGKVAIIGVGTSTISFGITAYLLQQGATVVVPAQSSHHLDSLRNYLSGTDTGKLVTLLTDLPDYEKAVELAELILEEYGPLDMVVFPFDQIAANDSFSNISIADWQRAVEENLAVYFICSRAAINAMKKRGEGMFVAIIDTDGPPKQKYNAMTDMLMTSQAKMARGFFEEVRNTGLKFHHLFINSPDAIIKNDHDGSEVISPEVIGKYIHSLYNDDRQSRKSPFLFFMGKEYPNMYQYFKNIKQAKY